MLKMQSPPLGNRHAILLDFPRNHLPMASSKRV